jgi:hypothetical protein
MTELMVAGLDRGECDRLARRLRTLAQHAALPVVVRITNDAIEVQRLGTLGACALIADGRKVAHSPFPGDAELETLLARWAAPAAADTLEATA